MRRPVLTHRKLLQSKAIAIENDLRGTLQIARRCGMKKAIVALARRLAVIMHRMWVDGTEFRWTRDHAAAAA